MIAYVIFNEVWPDDLWQLLTNASKPLLEDYVRMTLALRDLVFEMCCHRIQLSSFSEAFCGLTLTRRDSSNDCCTIIRRSMSSILTISVTNAHWGWLDESSSWPNMKFFSWALNPIAVEVCCHVSACISFQQQGFRFITAYSDTVFCSGHPTFRNTAVVYSSVFGLKLYPFKSVSMVFVVSIAKSRVLRLQKLNVIYPLLFSHTLW